MPTKAMKYCAKCNRLAVSSGLCEIHARQRQQMIQDHRDNKWLYLYKSARWQAMRDAQLRKDPLCCKCRKQNRLTPADTADHIKPHHGNPDLFYNADNMQSMCASCHSRKTASEDAGFGNPMR